MSKQERLILAAHRVWQAYLKFGPVDDGRPEGEEFTVALEELSKAKEEAKYSVLSHRSCGHKHE